MELRRGTPEEAGMSRQGLRRVTELAKGWVAQGVTPALVVLAARRGFIVLHEAFGCLTPEPDSSPLPLDAIFPLASIAKPITAAAAMVLVEEGLLGLNRPVSEYLPEFTGEAKHAVMVHHLLTHTSGLRDEDVDAHAEAKKGTVEIPPPEATQHPTIHEYLSLRYDAPLWKPPGTEMSYCNCGYTLLGDIVRRVSGSSLDDFARERIFEPLGMKDTSFVVPAAVRDRIVKRPADAPGAWFDSQESEETPWPHMGAFSAATDMAVFGQMFLNGGEYGKVRLLSPASVAEMTRNQIPGISAQYGEEFFPEASWGLGWGIHGNGKWAGSLHSPSAFMHPGAGGVFLWVDPVYGMVGVYFSVMAPLTALRDGMQDRKENLDLFMNAVTAAITDA